MTKPISTPRVIISFYRHNDYFGMSHFDVEYFLDSNCFITFHLPLLPSCHISPIPFVSIRFGETLLHVPGTHLSDEVAQPLLDLSRHGITITPIANSTTSTDNSSLTSSLSILKQNYRDPLSFFGRDQEHSPKRNVTIADLPSAALDLSNRGGG